MALRLANMVDDQLLATPDLDAFIAGMFVIDPHAPHLAQLGPPSQVEIRLPGTPRIF